MPLTSRARRQRPAPSQPDRGTARRELATPSSEACRALAAARYLVQCRHEFGVRSEELEPSGRPRQGRQVALLEIDSALIGQPQMLVAFVPEDAPRVVMR